jgi:hypothetical protein
MRASNLSLRSITFFAVYFAAAVNVRAQIPPRQLPAQTSSPGVLPGPVTQAGGAQPAVVESDGMKWRSPGGVVRTSGTLAPVSQPPIQPLPTAQLPAGQSPVQPVPGQPLPGQPLTSVQAAAVQTPAMPVRAREPIARVSAGPGTLPNDAGQEWREYDITPYTARVTSTVKPEQAVLDWILRETGYEAWHTQPLGILSVDNHRVVVYHTPPMQAVVQDIVDRFVNSEAESHVFGMRVITLGSPDWRAKHHPVLHPITAQTQGTSAWLLAKEDFALLIADLRRRSDFREHGTPHLMVNNGQSKQVSANQTRNYVRDVILKTDGSWPGYEPIMGQYDEGFKLEFSPLLSIDGAVVDAVIRCDVDQVEKMVPVMIDVPTTAAPRQRQKVEVSQGTSIRMHERFRWPTDQVLLISLGVGPAPIPDASGTLSVPLLSGPPRSEMLIFVESRGKLSAQPSAVPAQREASLYQNRY